MISEPKSRTERERHMQFAGAMRGCEARGDVLTSVQTKRHSTSGALGDGAIEERSLPAAGRLRYAPQDDGADGLDAWARTVGASSADDERSCGDVQTKDLSSSDALGEASIEEGSVSRCRGIRITSANQSTMEIGLV